jgi:hypothetical protein
MVFTLTFKNRDIPVLFWLTQRLQESDLLGAAVPSPRKRPGLIDDYAKHQIEMAASLHDWIRGGRRTKVFRAELDQKWEKMYLDAMKKRRRPSWLKRSAEPSETEGE